MIASGGLDFDDIANSSSSEEDSNKEKNSQRSDILNWSTDSSSSAISDLSASMSQRKKCPTSFMEKGTLNSNSIKQKEMVMSEIRRKVFSSDSERENEIYDTVDGLEFGKTPPRESRRTKQKYKCVKFNSNNSNSQFTVKKSDKKNTKNNQAPLSNGNFSYGWQRQRFEERKEKQRERIGTYSQERVSDFMPRSTKLVRVNSTKSLKSIAQQKSVNAFSRHNEYQGNRNRFMSSAVKLATKKLDLKKSSNRHHFHKSFTLLVNLGGRYQQQHSFETEEENFQVGSIYFFTLCIIFIV
jgi:hypothetical protein